MFFKIKTLLITVLLCQVFMLEDSQNKENLLEFKSLPSQSIQTEKQGSLQPQEISQIQSQDSEIGGEQKSSQNVSLKDQEFKQNFNGVDKVSKLPKKSENVKKTIQQEKVVQKPLKTPKQSYKENTIPKITQKSKSSSQKQIHSASSEKLLPEEPKKKEKTITKTSEKNDSSLEIPKKPNNSSPDTSIANILNQHNEENPFSFFQNLFNTPENPLQSFVKQLNNIIKQEKSDKDVENAELDTEYVMMSKPIFLEIDKKVFENDYLMVNFDGSAILNIKICNQKREKVHEFESIRTRYREKQLIPIETKLLQQFKGQILKFHLTFLVLNYEHKIKFTSIDQIDIYFNNALKIHPKLAKQIHITVSHQDEKFLKNDENRFQFIFKSSLKENEIHGDEQLRLFINKSKDEFPTEHEHDMEATGNTGFGLIKTINSGSPFFCRKKDCEYQLTLQISNLDFVSFIPSIFPNNSSIKFHNDMHLLEELEPNEIVTYKLVIGNENHKILFKLQETETATRFYIHPGSKPIDLEDYQYKSEPFGDQNILITSKELKKFNYSLDTFYVSFTSEEDNQASTFSFKVQVLNEDTVVQLKQYHSVSGLVFNNYIENFIIDFDDGSSKTLEVKINFILNHKGNASLILKECPLNEFEKCEIKNFDMNPSSSKHKFLLPNDQLQIKEGQKQGLLNFNVNCQGFDPLVGDRFFKNNYPISQKCRFVLGIQGHKVHGDIGSQFSLFIQGKPKILDLDFESSQLVTVYPNELKIYRYKISHNHLKPYATFNVIALNGECDVEFFFKEQNEPEIEIKNLQIENKDKNSLHSKQYRVHVKLEQHHMDEDILLNIKATKTCILDIYSSYMSEDQLEQNYVVERIKLNKIVYRTIQEQDNIQISSSKKSYFKSFLYKFEENEENSQYMQITLNSGIIGLELCVQMDNTEFNPNSLCDYQTFANTLRVKNDGKFVQNGKMLISIQRIVSNDDFGAYFPIDFNLLLENDGQTKVLSIFPSGQSYQKIIEANTTLNIQIDISKMRKNAMILMSTPFSYIIAGLKINLDDTKSLANLNEFNFGLEISNVQQFKTKYCNGKRKCVIYMTITNSGESDGLIDILLLFNDQPIHLKEGEQINVPSNRQMYFVTHPKNQKILSFNFLTASSKSVCFSSVYSFKKIKTKDFSSLVNYQRFDYKTNISEEGTIVQDMQYFKQYQTPTIIYTLIPKFDIPEIVESEYFQIFDSLNKTRVSLKSDIMKLQFYEEQYFKVMRGDFKYFQFHIESESIFTVFLNTQQGSSVLLMNKGLNKIPTLNSSKYKGENYKNQEIKISHENTGVIKGSYTIAVYAVEDSSFSVMIANNFDNLYQIQYQKLLSLKLKIMQTYYFDFLNNREEFTTFLYSDQSDIQIDLVLYDKEFNQNFMDAVKSRNNIRQSFIFRKGSPPRKKLNVSGFLKNSNYVICVKPLKMDTYFDIAIYDQKKPLEVPSSQRIRFSMEKGDVQIFKVLLPQNSDTVQFDIKLESGEVNYSLSDNEETFFKEENITRPSQVYTEYKDILKQNNNDLVVFSEVYLKIESKNRSSFSFMVKQENTFKQIKQEQTELIYTDYEKNQYLYFNIDSDQVKNITDFQISIENVMYFNQDPEFYYINDNDIVLNDDSPFLPLPIQDKKIITHKSVRHVIVKPIVTSGQFIIKIKTNPNKIPVKLKYSLYGEKTLEVNSFSTQEFPSKSDPKQFMIYLPESGEFRMLLETCGQLKFEKISFESETEKTALQLPKNLVQGYNILISDQTGEQKSQNESIEKILVNVQRVIVQKKGILRFQVNSDVYQVQKEKFFTLISEFKPKNKALVLKDYVELYQKIDLKTVSYEFTNENNLKISSLYPKFKPQLLQDYPNIQYIQVNFNVYVLDNEEFVENFMTCGVGAIHELDNLNPHVVFKKIPISEIRNSGNFEVFFKAEEIQKLSKSQNLTVFSHLDIFFLESEDEEYDITLDQKYTNVPYFILKIKNQNYSSFSSSSDHFKNQAKKMKNSMRFNYLIIVALLLLGLVAVYFCSRKGREEDVVMSEASFERMQYGREPEKLEMASFN